MGDVYRRPIGKACNTGNRRAVEGQRVGGCARTAHRASEVEGALNLRGVERTAAAPVPITALRLQGLEARERVGDVAGALQNHRAWIGSPAAIGRSDNGRTGLQPQYLHE